MDLTPKRRSKDVVANVDLSCGGVSLCATSNKKDIFLKQLMIYCVISKQGCLLGVFSCYQDAHIVAKRQGATVQQCSLNSECGIDAPACSSIAVSHAADHRGAVPNTSVPDRAQA